jgi:hypothetical protein
MQLARKASSTRRKAAAAKRHSETGATRGEATRNGEKNGGASRDRTDDLIVANDALSQLSYSPVQAGCIRPV